MERSQCRDSASRGAFIQCRRRHSISTSRHESHLRHTNRGQLASLGAVFARSRKRLLRSALPRPAYSDAPPCARSAPCRTSRRRRRRAPRRGYERGPICGALRVAAVRQAPERHALALRRGRHQGIERSMHSPARIWCDILRTFAKASISMNSSSLYIGPRMLPEKGASRSQGEVVGL